MKTLKKNLCLVLAMVMVFGLCTISASAKLEYYDNDAITYEEAVDVLSGLGILAGSNGQFRPTATITRAEAAKVLAYIMIGNSTQADALKASTAPFTDVPASHWAAGYIAYCNSRGIILGIGDGSYQPNANVTNIQFALMLLRALGYGTQKEYNTSDWPVKVASDAIRLGVFDGNLGGANSDAATREACALYAFNVIAKDRGTGSSHQYGLYKVTYSALAGDYVANGAFSSISSGHSVDANKKNTFGADFKLICKDAADDAFERETGHYWCIDEGNREAITANYDGGKLKAVYTTAVTGKDVWNLLGEDAIYSASPSVQVYVDGVNFTPSSDVAANKTLNPTDKESYGKKAVDNLDQTGNGVETYVYQWWESDTVSKVKICIVNTYLAKVSAVKAATSKKDREITLAYVDDDTQTGFNSKAKTYTTDDFAKGDYVLVNVADPETADASVEVVVPANPLKTEVSRVTRDGTKTTVTANGTTYATAKVTAANASDKIYKADDHSKINNTMVDGKAHTLFVDKHGYLIAASEITASSEYVYVAQFGYKTGHTDDLTDKGVFQADIYYADGSHKIVAIDSKTKADGTGDANGAADNFFCGKNGATAAAATVSAADTLNGSSTGLYKLDMVSGKAVLTRPTTTTTTGYSGMVITKGINNTFTTDGTMNGDTVFFYVSGVYGKSSWSVSAYTGINNVPAGETGKTEANQTIIITDAESNKIVKAVAVDNKLKGGDDTIVYLYSGKDVDYDKNGASVTYTLYTNGGETTEKTVSYKDTDEADKGIAESKTGFVYLTGDGRLAWLTSESGKSYAEVNKVYYAWDEQGVEVDNGDDTTMTFKGKKTPSQTVTLGVGNAKVVDLVGLDISSVKDIVDYDDVAKLVLAVEFTGGENGTATVIYIVDKTT